MFTYIFPNILCLVYIMLLAFTIQHISLRPKNKRGRGSEILSKPKHQEADCVIESSRNVRSSTYRVSLILQHKHELSKTTIDRESLEGLNHTPRTTDN